jgi:hypothetical protein
MARRYFAELAMITVQCDGARAEVEAARTFRASVEREPR